MKSLALLGPLVVVSSLALCSAGNHPVLVPDKLVRFEAMKDTLPARFDKPFSYVFKSARDYRWMFGHDASGVDFSKQWVVICSLGKQNPLSYVEVSDIRVTDGGDTLSVTALGSTNACTNVGPPQAVYAMAKFDAPVPKPALTDVQFMIMTPHYICR